MGEDDFNYNSEEDKPAGVMERLKKIAETPPVPVHEIHVFYRVKVNWYELALAVVLVVIFLKEYGVLK